MKIDFYFPSRKWAQRENSSKDDSRALANIDASDFQTKNNVMNQLSKAYKPTGSSWVKSHGMKLEPRSSVLHNLEENWSLKHCSSTSFFSDTNIHDYMREDKENELVKSVEKSLNDWEGTLDNIVATDGDRIQSNAIDFGLIGKE